MKPIFPNKEIWKTCGTIKKLIIKYTLSSSHQAVDVDDGTYYIIRQRLQWTWCFTERKRLIFATVYDSTKKRKQGSEGKAMRLSRLAVWSGQFGVPRKTRLGTGASWSGIEGESGGVFAYLLGETPPCLGGSQGKRRLSLKGTGNFGMEEGWGWIKTQGYGQGHDEKQGKIDEWSKARGLWRTRQRICTKS